MRELSLHVLDIARNSVEAGADEIEITIRENTREDIIRFTVLDNGPGIDPKLLPLIADPFYTTKEKKKRIGLGLSLFKAAAERCDGSFKIETLPGKGTAVTAVFRRSHIDRAPLGDMPGTIITMLTDPELTDLIYSHELDDRSFRFELKPLKERFGRIPVNDPAVLCLVREHLEEGIRGLYGGVNDEIPRRTGKPA